MSHLLTLVNTGAVELNERAMHLCFSCSTTPCSLKIIIIYVSFQTDLSVLALAEKFYFSCKICFVFQ